jgi:methionyl-tRNA synthetase
MSRRVYITTSIPYVNGDPHVGFALECVQADVLARHRRLRGDEVRFLSGTDDNSLKNVRAAEAAGIPVASFVDAKARHFAALREPLQLSYDDFIRTSTERRHRTGVQRLWRGCTDDLYQRDYEGLYCTGCEAFVDGPCSEHEEPPEHVRERNWFFSLSRYADELLELIESGALRIEPPHRRNEVLSFIRAGLADFSVSRSVERARGWGIPVPDDPAQVIYVWFDALAKGILRFHAVYWPAILLSAREPLPTTILVHEYLTVRGRKLAKSVGDGAGPAEIVERLGADGLRWWFARDVASVGDTDFREELVAVRANELADRLGNLVNRTIALGPTTASARVDGIDTRIDEALARFDLRAAADVLWSLVEDANRHISAARPWELAGDEREAVLAPVVAACRTLARELQPFLPEAAARIETALDRRDLEIGRALFTKVASG